MDRWMGLERSPFQGNEEGLEDPGRDFAPAVLKYRFLVVQIVFVADRVLIANKYHLK